MAPFLALGFTAEPTIRVKIIAIAITKVTVLAKNKPYSYKNSNWSLHL
jgi:mannose/fructose/N-acetylgalactosamine-specific phosphotransferase system component IIC